MLPELKLKVLEFLGRVTHWKEGPTDLHAIKVEVRSLPNFSGLCSKCQTPNTCGGDSLCLEEYIQSRLKQLEKPL
jgi:hypothetical protein